MRIYIGQLRRASTHNPRQQGYMLLQGWHKVLIIFVCILMRTFYLLLRNIELEVSQSAKYLRHADKIRLFGQQAHGCHHSLHWLHSSLSIHGGQVEAENPEQIGPSDVTQRHLVQGQPQSHVSWHARPVVSID